MLECFWGHGCHDGGTGSPVQAPLSGHNATSRESGGPHQCSPGSAACTRSSPPSFRVQMVRSLSGPGVLCRGAFAELGCPTGCNLQCREEGKDPCGCGAEAPPPVCLWPDTVNVNGWPEWVDLHHSMFCSCVLQYLVKSEYLITVFQMNGYCHYYFVILLVNMAFLSKPRWTGSFSEKPHPFPSAGSHCFSLCISADLLSVWHPIEGHCRSSQKDQITSKVRKNTLFPTGLGTWVFITFLFPDVLYFKELVWVNSLFI